MKSPRRYQSQLLLRRSYKPERNNRIRSAVKVSVTFQPVNRFGVKPQLVAVR